MDQITFSEAEYQTKKRKTRREIFLERMDKLGGFEGRGRLSDAFGGESAVPSLAQP